MINRTHVWFAAFVVLIFAAGLAAGVVLDRTIRFPGSGVPGFRGPGFRGPGGGRDGGRGPDGPPTEAFVRDLSDALALNADQQSKITTIVDARRPRLRALQEAASKKFADEQQTLHDEIATVLTPEQLKKFDDLQKDRRFGGSFGRRGR